MLEYRRVKPVPSSLTLEVLPGSVVLIDPPSPRWERALLIFWAFILFGKSAACVWLIWFIASLAPRGTTSTFPRMRMLWPVAVYAAIFFCLGMVVVWQLINHFRYGITPRQLKLTPTHLNYIRRGLWGIRFRRYESGRITGILVRDIKGLNGRVARRILVIKLGRWRRIRVRFGHKYMDLAIETEAAFRRILSSQGNGSTVNHTSA